MSHEDIKTICVIAIFIIALIVYVIGYHITYIISWRKDKNTYFPWPNDRHDYASLSAIFWPVFLLCYVISFNAFIWEKIILALPILIIKKLRGP